MRYKKTLKIQKQHFIKDKEIKFKCKRAKVEVCKEGKYIREFISNPKTKR